MPIRSTMKHSGSKHTDMSAETEMEIPLPYTPLTGGFPYTLTEDIDLLRALFSASMEKGAFTVQKREKRGGTVKLKQNVNICVLS